MVVESNVTVDGVTTLWISGGCAPDNESEIQLLATTSVGRKIGRNVPLRLLRR